MANHRTATPHLDDHGEPTAVRHRYLGGTHRGRHENAIRPVRRPVANVLAGAGLAVVAVSTAWVMVLAATPGQRPEADLPPAAGRAAPSWQPPRTAPAADSRASATRPSRSGPRTLPSRVASSPARSAPSVGAPAAARGMVVAPSVPACSTALPTSSMTPDPTAGNP